MKVTLQGFDKPREREPEIQIVRKSDSIEVYYEGTLRYILNEGGEGLTYRHGVVGGWTLRVDKAGNMTSGSYNLRVVSR